MSQALPSVLEAAVSHRLCSGCGVCAGLLPRSLRMVTDPLGMVQPEALGDPADEDWARRSLQVCPFSGQGPNEDALAGELYADLPGIRHRSETGYYLDAWSAHVTDEAQRIASTSGGIITWLAGELLRTGAAQAVACVGPVEAPDRLFDYQLIRDPAGLARCRKSRYYPVELSRVLPAVRELDGRAAVIGLPCFLTALRRAMRLDPVLRAKIGATIGLFCGHLKSKRYVAYLARHCGVDERGIVAADFRKKNPGREASDYSFQVTTRQEGRLATREIPMRDVYAGGWSYNLFMLPACDCCDDVMAETADVAVGDAWLPEFVKDWRGASVVLARSQPMRALLLGGAERGELALAPLEVEQVIGSQAGALRHRRAGLAYRLDLARARGQWRPPRRVAPNRRSLPPFNRLIQRLRVRISAASHLGFARQQAQPGLEIFKRHVRFWIYFHDKSYIIKQFIQGVGKKIFRFH